MEPMKNDWNLEFRPASYWDVEDPVTAIVANITGELRRTAVRAALKGNRAAAGSMDADDEALADHLSDQRRLSQSRLHPWCMGGEFLPPYLPGEVEIARIAMQSVTMDVIAVRARRQGGRIRYRVVDEYDRDCIASWGRKSSVRPLTLRQLVELIDSIRGPMCAPDQSTMDEIRESIADEGGGPQRAAAFFDVTSEFYPQLQAWYEREAEKWLDSKRERCSDCGATSLPDEDHDCPEGRAREARERSERERRERERAAWAEPRLAPFSDAMACALDDYRTLAPRPTSWVLGSAERAKAHALERFLKSHVIYTGAMPTGVHAIEWRFMNHERRTFQVDFDTLAARARRARGEG